MRIDSAFADLGTWQAWSDPEDPVRLGVSTCLLGEEVRYDGGTCRDAFLTQAVLPFAQFVPVCPEVELGLGIPRPTLRLHDTPGTRDQRLLVPSTGEDLTDAMEAYAKARVARLREQDLDGYVLKKASPSCGMTRMKVYGPSGPHRKTGVGTYAQVLLNSWPDLPVEEEGRLNDPLLRHQFIQRAFSHNRWRVFRKGSPGVRELVRFHSAHKMLLRAHDEAGYQRLGQLVANGDGLETTELLDAYGQEFRATLSNLCAPKRHMNVLQHARGYLKDQLEVPEKQQIDTAIEDYRGGLLPLIVPISLLRMQAIRHDITYLRGQLYFDPHPKELMLRNRI